MIRKSDNANFSRTTTIKALLFIGLLIVCIKFPVETLHFFAGVAHTVYESVAFAVEELLTHVFGFSKFQAQMFVFYTSCAIGAGILYRMARHLPLWLKQAKRYCIQCCERLRQRWQAYWDMLPVLQKLQLLVVEFAFLAGSVGYMLV
ncbi:hypothetical protein [Methylomonas koyamae]|uniref:hypothetical protein n=1 Tax=Methylomonas koyamae TaxID=702114 RepID=UPI002873A8AA|nr:hypothetical protein [Methylomonas koyamae]WNB77619.1 hypothetical protein RI210_08570 [Methylomonas koyamae]